MVQGRAKDRRGHETRKGWEQANCCWALGSHRPPGHPCDTTRPPRLRFCERPGGVRRSTVSVPCPFGTLTNLQLFAIGDPIGGLWHRSDSPGEHRGGRSSIGRERTWYFFGCTENGYSTDADGNRGGKLPLSKNHKWEAWGGPIPVHMWYVSFGAQPCVEVRRPWRPRYRGNNPWLFSSCTANIRGRSAPDKPIIQGKGCKLDVWDRVLELDDQCAPKYPVNALGSMHVFCLYVEAQKAARSVEVALRVVVCRVAGGSYMCCSYGFVAEGSYMCCSCGFAVTELMGSPSDGGIELRGPQASESQADTCQFDCSRPGRQARWGQAGDWARSVTLSRSGLFSSAR